MSNGWVAPCPYFPLVFGDATREPVMDVFERIQSHPLVRLGGEFCPMRNPDYITQHLNKLGMDRPFFPIEVNNQIDLGAPCEAGCAGCDYATQSEPRPAAEVLRDLARVDPNYSRVEFFGGDALARGDLFEILQRVPARMEVTLWSACRRLPPEDALADRLRRCGVGAVKVMLPPHLTDAATWGEAAWREVVGVLQRARALGVRGVPVQLYVPANAAAPVHQFLSSNVSQLCLERVYLFERDASRPLINAAACFGKMLGSVRLVWRRPDAPVRMTQPLVV
jgi:MoaA/NifB/PqqE/SkfB family radical SAM enzyme